jgi:hypothetical protein
MIPAKMTEATSTTSVLSTSSSHVGQVTLLNSNGDVVTGHYHFYTFRQVNLTGYVSGAQVKLGTIFVVEWRVTSTLFFLQDINLRLKFGMRGN